MALRDELADAGFTTMVFHSNGVGGPAMEELAAEGWFRGVIDFTTNEVTDPLVGGIHDGGRTGCGSSASSGCRRSSCRAASTSRCSSRPGCPPSWPTGRATTTTRSSGSSAPRRRTCARWRHLRGAAGRRQGSRCGSPCPTRGLSIPNTPTGPFWDPDADAGFRTVLRERLRDDIPITEHDQHVNDPEFGRLVARLFLDLLPEAPA
jgi:uncharacterized protein (UPF0261 family)